MSRPEAYKENEPYIFVSYCHKDDARVWPVIEGLQKRGMRVWYDEGIEWGSHWDEVIFEHLSGCACVVAFVTGNFLQSENCMDEISYAKDEKKGPFIVFLDNLELTGMMKYRYGRLQALNLHQFDGMDALLDTLCETQALSTCRGTAASSTSSRPATQQSTPAYQPPRPSEAEIREWSRKGDEYYKKKEYTEAVKWYRKAAEQGYVWSQYRLGQCFLFGNGVERNAAEAVNWLRKSAEQGRSGAQYYLGYCYSNGMGIARDEIEGVKWYRKAAEQGDSDAQYNLGVCYANGEGVVPDQAEAVKWYRKAAKQGQEDAQRALTNRGLTW